jgi:hypothetical protein
MKRMESLYVVSAFGQDRFIWATSAAEARSRAASAMRASSPPGRLVSSVADGHIGDARVTRRQTAEDKTATLAP